MSGGWEWQWRYKSEKGFESAFALLSADQNVILICEVLMEVNLTPKVEAILREKVESGQFSSLEEAANELLALAIEEEKLSNEDVVDLRREVQRGIEQADRGQFVEFDAEQIIKEKKAAARKQKAG